LNWEFLTDIGYGAKMPIAPLPKIEQEHVALSKVAMNFHVRHGNCVPNCQSIIEVALENFKGLSQNGVWARFSSSLCASLFNKDLSNDTIFMRNIG
jgi:hypothetical protein